MYTLGRVLGRGQFGTTRWRCTRPAARSMHASRSASASCCAHPLRAVAPLASLRHPFTRRISEGATQRGANGEQTNFCVRVCGRHSHVCCSPPLTDPAWGSAVLFWHAVTTRVHVPGMAAAQKEGSESLIPDLAEAFPGPLKTWRMCGGRCRSCTTWRGTKTSLRLWALSRTSTACTWCARGSKAWACSRVLLEGGCLQACSSAPSGRMYPAIQRPHVDAAAGVHALPGSPLSTRADACCR